MGTRSSFSILGSIGVRNLEFIWKVLGMWAYGVNFLMEYFVGLIVIKVKFWR